VKMRITEIAKVKLSIYSLAVLLPLGQAARADTLELRTGQIVQGKFLGGSSVNIRFRVNGQEEIFATQDVLNIGFSEPGDLSSASTVAPEPQAPPRATPPPETQAAPAAPATPPQPDPTALASNGAPPARGPSVTIPAGTTVFVRMIDGIDSSQNKIGDTFRASLESALVVGDTVVAPKGADAYGKLTQVKAAGNISGAAELTLELAGIRIGGNIVPLDSTDYDVAGKGRGAQSAQRIGGAAVIGTILGAIAGGGRGAAIGGVAGAGAGTAVQVMTHGQQVRVPSETLLEFRLQQDVAAPLAAPSN
jgi:hypothetical protein